MSNRLVFRAAVCVLSVAKLPTLIIAIIGSDLPSEPRLEKGSNLAGIVLRIFAICQTEKYASRAGSIPDSR